MPKRGDTEVRPAGSSDGARLAVDLVRGLEGMAGLEADWLGLEGAAGDPDFFQSFAWSMQVAEVRLRGGDGRYEPMAAVARRDGATVALWPLAREKRAGQFELRALDDPFGQFAGVLARDSEAGIGLVERTLALAKVDRIADAACFERVIAGSILHRGLGRSGAQARNPVDAPVVSFTGVATFADFIRQRNKKTMKNHRNAVNRIGRVGQITSVAAREPGRTAAIGNAALAHREEWLKATGRTAPAFRIAGFSEILTGDSRWGLEGKRIAFELQVGGKSIAQQLGYVHGGRYYAFISGMDWAHEELRPGSVHLALVLEEAMKAGVTTAELLTPASDYKMVWTDDVRHLEDMAVAISTSGRIKQVVWDGGLRPAVKAAYYAMPAPFRRALANWAHGTS